MLYTFQNNISKSKNKNTMLKDVFFNTDKI